MRTSPRSPLTSTLCLIGNSSVFAESVEAQMLCPHRASSHRGGYGIGTRARTGAPPLFKVCCARSSGRAAIPAVALAAAASRRLDALPRGAAGSSQLLVLSLRTADRQPLRCERHVSIINPVQLKSPWHNKAVETDAQVRPRACWRASILVRRSPLRYASASALSRF